MKKMNRRSILKGALALSMVSILTPSTPVVAAANSKTKKFPVLLGGPVFAKTNDPMELAIAHKKLGYRAAYCPGAELKDTDRIKAISDAFSKQQIVIAEVGRWVNLMDADPEKRKKNMAFVTDGLALAEAVGARCCVDIAGSFNEKSWFGPHKKNFSKEFFDAAVENARKIIDAVKPTRSKFAYEMMGWAMPNDVECYLKLIKAIDRKGFGVHLDPCNMINCPELFYENTRLLNQCFDKLGKHIVSCHAKDLSWLIEMNVHFVEVRPGLGELDYVTYLQRLSELPHQPPLMIEHLPNAEEYDKAKEHIFEVGKKNDISFGV